MKTKSKVSTQRVVITPVQASNWLSKNTANRPINERLIKGLTREIQKGKWELTTDAIGFDTTGKLINGQHRLHACVRANKDMECFVAYGLEPDSFNVIDTGKMRSAGDILGVHGFKAPSSVAAVVKFILAWNIGLINTGGRLGKRDIGISNQDILDYAEKHKLELEDIMNVSQMTTKDFKAIRPIQVGGMYAVLRKLDRDHAMTFFSYLSTGIGLTKDDPIYVLRQKLNNDLAAKKKFPDRDKLAWIILAWNHSRKKNKITKLQWAGDSTSAFPKPI